MLRNFSTTDLATSLRQQATILIARSLITHSSGGAGA
jgi:hypothetical protein